MLSSSGTASHMQLYASRMPLQPHRSASLLGSQATMWWWIKPMGCTSQCLSDECHSTRPMWRGGLVSGDLQFSFQPLETATGPPETQEALFIITACSKHPAGSSM